MLRHSIAAAILGLSCCLAAPAGTDESPIPQVSLPMPVDSGWVQTHGDARGVAFSTVVRVPGRTWLRLVFDQATLGRTPTGGQTTVVRVMSLLDGGTQHLHTLALEQWGNTSAYFNGDAVLVEIVADPNAPRSRLVMSQVLCGAPYEPGEGGAANLCLGADDRVLSSEAANGRLMPFGCTAWIFNDPNRTLLTAGHCDPHQTDVVQFNVPLSSGSGVATNPPPEHQYAVDGTSAQRLDNDVGDDWCYFGCYANSNTGLTPYQAQGAMHTLAPAPALGEPAQTIRITGYGTVVPPMPLTWNLVQKTHVGPMAPSAGTIVAYQADTSGGNSGSPIVDESAGVAIGIHTHGGCDGASGANQGTASQHPGLQNALANPRGVCIPVAQLQFTYPDGLPDGIAPAGDSIRVLVGAGAGGEPVPGTGTLHLDTGDGYASIAMQQVEPDVYDAVFPPIACGTPVHYYFSAESDSGGEARAPVLAPVVAYNAASATTIAVHIEDTFEQDLGWTSTASGGVTTGFWSRTTPTATGPRVPMADGDQSGQCFVTDNAQNADIDGGSVTLTSPTFDASEPGATLHYWRWFSTSSISLEDTMVVQVSPDDGTSWLTAETFTSNGIGWYRIDMALHDVPGFRPSSQCKVRFVATDTGALSSVEAGIDGVVVRNVQCTPACPADFDGDGAVGGSDLGALLSAWGERGGTAADLDGDADVDGADLGLLLGAWGPCGTTS